MADLMTVNEVADKLAISVRQCWKLAGSGRLPAPVKVGGSRSVRWRSQDIELYVSVGCSMRDFEAATPEGTVQSG